MGASFLATEMWLVRPFAVIIDAFKSLAQVTKSMDTAH